MALPKPTGKIMKDREEGNKAVSSQGEVAGRGRRHPTEIKQRSAAQERGWMSLIPTALERGMIRPPHGAALDLVSRKTAPFLINVHFIYAA